MNIDTSLSQTEFLAMEQAFQRAVAQHQAGELHYAEKSYRAILSTCPNHPKVNHNLGAVYVQMEQPAVGLPFFAVALDAEPTHGQYWLSYIDALSRAGQSENARAVLALAQQSGLEGDEVDVLAARLKDHGQPKEADPAAVPVSRNSAQQAQPMADNLKKNIGKSSRHHGKEPSAQASNELIMLFSQGRYQDAAVLAKAMTQKFPQFGIGWKVMGAAIKQMGNNIEALAPMQKAAALLPKDAEVQKNLGIILQALGRADEAVTSLKRSLQINSDNADAHCNLGVSLQSLGRSVEAESSYWTAIKINPDFAEAHNNLGTILHAKGLLDDAEISYRRAIEIKPDFADAHFNLGATLHAKGQMDEALVHFQHRARLAPGNAVDQHLILSLTGKNTERAPAEYVEKVFDNYAEKFDTHLLQVLGYETPKKLMELISRHAPNADKWDVLDLGCGTGLAGVEVTPFAKRLVGVDLSAKMLEQARARKLYQRLDQADLVPMMQGEPTASFDVIVAADVFVYLGKLDDVIAEARRLLRPGGILAFSIEDCDVSSSQSAIQGEGPDYRLKNTGRYGQSVGYLARLASANGYLVEEMLGTQLRTERGKPIVGHIVLWSMPSDPNSTVMPQLTTDQLLQQAVTCHQSGRLQDAESLYRKILEVEPNQSKVNHNLGALYMQREQPAASLPLFAAALDADPACGQYWLSYIHALHQSGQLDVAQEVLALARQHGLSGDDVDALAASLGGGQAVAAGMPSSFCPVCRNDQVSFLPLPAFYLESARLHGFAHLGKGEMVSLDQYTCNRCGASDRERLYALWVDQQLETDALSRFGKVMHFAPEDALSKRLRQLFADYKTADFGMDNVDYKVDIQNLPFPDESYDFFICSHVMEHVESDDQAIRELYRITKTGGCGILVAPVIVGLGKTVEDPSVKDAAGRWRLYGQDDHVRLYAHDDYVNKIRSHGFRVSELGEGYFGEDVFRSLGLIRTSILYVVNK